MNAVSNMHRTVPASYLYLSVASSPALLCAFAVSAIDIQVQVSVVVRKNESIAKTRWPKAQPATGLITHETRSTSTRSSEWLAEPPNHCPISLLIRVHSNSTSTRTIGNNGHRLPVPVQVLVPQFSPSVTRPHEVFCL
jgi:hypothetical protein